MIEVETIIREYIDKTVHMSLATVKDNKPWVCEVHFAYDHDLNLYFVSKIPTRHCQEIIRNPNVAGNIVKQHGLEDLPAGIYFEGTAEILEDATEEDVRRYCDRLGRDENEVGPQLTEENGRSMFKITVNNWAAFGKFGEEHMQKHVLKWSN